MARMMVVMLLAWLALIVGAPIMAGYHPMPEPKHICPSPAISHGVGGNLKTYAQPIDRCTK